jgi:hypothetical protein
MRIGDGDSEQVGVRRGIPRKRLTGFPYRARAAGCRTSRGTENVLPLGRLGVPAPDEAAWWKGGLERLPARRASPRLRAEMLVGGAEKTVLCGRTGNE